LVPGTFTKHQYIGAWHLYKKDRRILHLVGAKEEIRRGDVLELTGLSPQGASARLKRLVDRGFLVMHGTRRAAYYTLPDDD
jgi:DNA-binding Lrp family transcriptional regulator